MANKILLNTAVPPSEVVRLLNKHSRTKKHVEGWLAVPSINPPHVRLSQKDLREKGVVDDPSQLLTLLRDKTFRHTIGTMDLLTGCGYQCDTCLADAALPSRMFSLKWFKAFFKNKKAISSLLPDYLRLGWTGDVLDHPDFLKIIKLILFSTRVLDSAVRKKSKGKKRHTIHVFTNFRPNKKAELDALIALAAKNKERLAICISLPLNLNDTVNIEFSEYVKARSKIFGRQNKRYSDGLIEMDSNKFKLKNLAIQDVHHPGLLFRSGRVIPEKIARKKTFNLGYVEADRDQGYRHRGAVEIYLNPDALWLLIHATMHESHTTFVYTPINAGNIKAFSKLPWRSFYVFPPNWKNGKMVLKSWKRIAYIKRSFKKAVRPVTVRK